MDDEGGAAREGRGQMSRAARPVLGVVLLAVLGVMIVLLPRDGGADERSAPSVSPSASGVMPSETPSVAPSDETFCASYRALAEVQAQYASDPSDGQISRLLRDMSDDLIATGVPDSMGPLVRAGYLIEISGIYESLGETLDRRAVPGAAEDAGDGTSISGPAGAFGRWLAELCPA